jgi:glutamyl-tRNA synthetase
MSVSEQDRSSMEKYALQNAVKHAGKAELGAVVSKVLGDNTALRSMAKEVARAATEVVGAVNALTPEQQLKALEEKYPEMLVEKKAEEGRVGLPALEGAVKGQVVLRLPPEPSGFMHIGHAMAFTINSEYRNTYDGTLWLRFEDTNPRKVAEKYYESFREGLAWLSIKWDKEKSVSSDLDIIYGYGTKLIAEGNAFACACSPETVKKLRFEGTPCEHRNNTVELNLSIWEGMLARKYLEGKYVIRLRGDLASLDYSLRDPNILRIIDHPHPITGAKYVVWPTYDFEVVVEDHLCGVTHILRSSEFHADLQETIRKMLGFKPLHLEQFSRFNFKGTPVGKRYLRPLVEEGVVKGWDDPRMPTIEGVRRRGILPEAIRQFTLHVGYTKTEHTFEWSLLFAINRKILDPISKRLYFAPEPVRLTVDGAPRLDEEVPYHPTEKGLGSRTMRTAGVFYVAGSDIESMKEGDLFRLIELYNVRLVSKKDGEVRAEFAGRDLIKDSRKIQWVPAESGKEIEVLEPSELYNEDGSLNKDSLKARRGIVEESFSQLQPGDIVQFLRYGFVRVDSPTSGILAHG